MKTMNTCPSYAWAGTYGSLTLQWRIIDDRRPIMGSRSQRHERMYAQQRRKTIIFINYLVNGATWGIISINKIVELYASIIQVYVGPSINGYSVTSTKSNTESKKKQTHNVMHTQYIRFSSFDQGYFINQKEINRPI